MVSVQRLASLASTQKERVRIPYPAPHTMKYNTTDLKHLVSMQTVRFVEYRKGFLYYNVVGFPDFIFPVPVEDTGDATFKAEDKPIYYMRYIRKFLVELENSND